MINTELRALVFEAMDNAKANDAYASVEGISPEAEAVDLLDYCGGLEGYTVDDLLPHVRAWIALNR